MTVSNRLLAVMLGLALLVGAALALAPHLTRPRATVNLVFTPVFGGQPLIFDRFAFKNPAGAEAFQVHDFRFFLSNITVSGAEGRYVEPDSYHLVRFDGGDATYRIALEDVPLGTLSRVSFSIGVDAAANSSLEARGDLDPNSRMAWNWEVGYKFVLVEGGIRIDDVVQPLVYHVGFDENRRDLTFEAPEGFALRDGADLRFSVDLRKMFAGATQIDMARLQSVKFDRADARRLADNYASMISVDWD